MNIKLISALILIPYFVLLQASGDRGWRGIVPLHSSKADVLEKLGLPHGVGGSGYIFEDVSVFFDYSSKPCQAGWKVPIGTVLAFSVNIRKNRPKFSDLNLDLRQYEKRNDIELLNTTYYENKKLGVTYVVLPNGEVTTIHYGPSEDDNSLKCETPPPEMSLRLSASIIDQRYCNDGHDEYDNLQMKLRLKYTNVGSGPLLLYKHDFIAQELISNTAEDAAARRLRASKIVAIDADRLKIDDATLSKSLTILAPGSSYEEREARVSIFAARSSEGESAGYLRPGEYVLQVKMFVWPNTESSLETLRARWQGSGFLWSDNVVSIPMPFKVEKERLVLRCSPW